MVSLQTGIIEQLRRDMLLLQGYKPVILPAELQAFNGPIRYAFPNQAFPLGSIHEFICNGKEGIAASSGFLSGILSFLLKGGGICCWVTSNPLLFPPGLKMFNLNPSQMLVIRVPSEKEIAWTIEEILKSSAVVAVVAEIKEIGFKQSRRFQLAAEQSGITCFTLRNNPQYFETCAAARWSIVSLPSKKETTLPGISYPRWNVELLKVRNGKTGNWQLEWKGGNFNYIQDEKTIIEIPLRKIG